MILYETSWRQEVKKRKGKNAGKVIKERRAYETKSLTPMHEEIRLRYKGARTIRYDTSIQWAFGTWAQMIGQS